MKTLALTAMASLSLLHAQDAGAARRPPNDGKLRIIAFGAHPDDAEFKAGGTAALWAAQGHHVKFVSMTNGDLGHYASAGGPLARRRLAEVQQAARILGIQTEVMDIHDGELMPSLENRKAMVRLIREWQADLVLAHRPNDYNPDHRYVGVLAQDSAFMVTVPFYALHTPPVEPNPVFMYFSDNFKKPAPFQADVAVAIDDVFERKIEAVDALASQVYETVYGVDAKTRQDRLSRIPKDAAGRKAYARDLHGARYAAVANAYRDALVKWYGAERGKRVKYAEAFEICEYGRQPSAEDLRKLFPFMLVAAAAVGPGADPPGSGGARLFNGKNLDGFDTFLKESGLNKDPSGVFRVHDGAVHVSGTEYGYFITKKEYENYHLKAEFKWGDQTYAPRKDMARDSGILFHVAGPDQVWPKSIEFQMIEGRTGEVILVGDGASLTANGETRTRGETKNTRFARHGQGPWQNVAGYRSPENEVEKPHGEWNLLELIADGGKVTFKVNGKVVNEGSGAKPSRGRILFQSEGAELFFRNIELRPLGK